MAEQIVEMCPNCGNEVAVWWDMQKDGYQIFCPYCGKPMMLCSMCDRSPCDWAEEKGCKHSAGEGNNVPTNDGWIPVEERLPEKNEYFVDTSRNKDFPNGYYRRLEIAYMTDTIEYVHGCYDGYKWMDKYLNAIKNVVAWRIHEPYQPKTITQRTEWKDRMLHTFLGGHHD